ncbi:Mrp/NBP35 family ATP-binding protein [Nocardioides sp. T2.26MG-1]|uniref:Mrp/NBP35 family ATP-binding protein n=1 Tax=Nocardioides sp. T2.26MG-1 TaxID=3041166 RepID=UPI0024773E75|nr:Mrp/NBP35 family ATP-binding protein [Nocardioides sp. T2.26MG-1]CAI9418966.1 Iron-sulfur cluster carrier protein [Nocardioides sp. T2.26MG-1]
MRVLPRHQVFATVDLEAARSAVGAVRDPELGLTLAEAGMLADLRVGRGGVLHATVRLTTPTCPMREQIGGDVATAAGAVAGVTRVEVRFEAMTDPERMSLSARLRGGRESGHPFGPDSGTRVYAVASGKGGVGKSTVTANLAVALAQQGKRVGVLDADVWGWSVPQLFGVRRPPVALKGLMLPLQAHGVALMSVGFLVDGDEPVVWRGPMLHKAIEQFLGDVHWGELDVLLIDLPPGTGDVTLTLLELLPDAQLLAVTTPQVAAQTVAARVGRMALDARMPVAGVIENMSALVCSSCDAHTPLFGEGGGERLAAGLGTALLGQVPLDLPLRTAGDLGTPAMVAAPDAASVVELRRIAASLPVVRRSLVGRSLSLTVV